MSAELLNFEDSWMKLNVANLHLQIDFVRMGVCTHTSGIRRVGFRAHGQCNGSVPCLSLSMGLCDLVPRFLL